VRGVKGAKHKRGSKAMMKLNTRGRMTEEEASVRCPQESQTDPSDDLVGSVPDDPSFFEEEGVETPCWGERIQGVA